MVWRLRSKQLLVLVLAFFHQNGLLAFLVKSNNRCRPTRSCSSSTLFKVSSDPDSLQELSVEEKKKKVPKGTSAKKKTTTGSKTVIKGSKSAKAKKSTKTGKTTKGKKKGVRKKAQKNNEPAYWIVESDKFLLEYGNSNTTQGVSLLHCTVRGNPRPLRRHRTAYGRMYNPSEKLQDSFREAIDKLIFSNETIKKPLFDAHESLVMTIIFRLKRPKKDFVGGKPGPGRLRENAPPQTAQTRTDVDNLIKFVFDSMNEILYDDDRQIISVHVIKFLDNEDLCEGSTEILLRSVDERDIEKVTTNSLKIVDLVDQNTAKNPHQ